MDQKESKKEKRFFGLDKNVLSMSAVSFLNDVSSEMVYPFIPIFLTTVLGASVAFVGLVEGIADATASILKIFAGRLSDKIGKRKPIVVLGYSLSAIAKPILSFATAPWQVLVVRFMDRVGKGTREAPRDALISSSVEKKDIGKAFGFNRGADRMGATLGPFLAFLILPLINNDLRTLFLFSFVASFFAVLVLIIFVKDTKALEKQNNEPKIKFEFNKLSTSFRIFIFATTLFSLAGATETMLILRAKDVGVPIVLLPIIYLVYNLTYSLFSVPAGVLADKFGHRNTYMLGMVIFSGTYILFANITSSVAIWFVFAIYGLYSAFTDGVGRAIVSDLVGQEEWKATAYGVYSAVTGLALLPGSLIFGLIWDNYGASMAFYYGAILGIFSLFAFAFLRIKDQYGA
ncbi:MAG: MFS transporter [bacterium]